MQTKFSMHGRIHTIIGIFISPENMTAGQWWYQGWISLDAYIKEASYHVIYKYIR